MNALRNAAATFTLLASAASIWTLAQAQADEADAHLAMKPVQAVRLQADGKTIVGSFVATDGQCSLSLIIADADRDGAGESALRIQTILAPGGASTVDAGAGHALRFACESGARAMSVAKLGQARGVSGGAPLAKVASAQDLLRAEGL